MDKDDTNDSAIKQVEKTLCPNRDYKRVNNIKLVSEQLKTLQLTSKVRF